MNVKAQEKFELAYDDSTVDRFNHYTTKTPPPTILSSADWIKWRVNALRQIFKKNLSRISSKNVFQKLVFD